MEKTLHAHVRKILEALPEDTDEAAVLKPVFESMRKKNPLLNKIIKRQTLCAREVMDLVHWVNALKWNVPSNKFAIDKDLKLLIDTSEWFPGVGRIPPSYVEAECAYESAGAYGIIMGILLTVIGGVGMLVIFGIPLVDFLKQFGLGGSLFTFLVFAIGNGFLMRRSLSKNWINMRKEVVENALARAKLLDEKIQLAYKGDRDEY